MAQTYDPVAKLNELIKGIDFAMLTTIRSDGSLHSCPMATQEVDRDGVIWFFSDSNTQKVEAIRTDHRVNLAYSDVGSQRYVSVAGRCELVRDVGKAKQLWSPLYRTWFPKGLDDPNLRRYTCRRQSTGMRPKAAWCRYPVSPRQASLVSLDYS